MAQASIPGDPAGGAKIAFPPHRLQVPEWLGWCLMSIGAVLVLHSLALPRPKG